MQEGQKIQRLESDQAELVSRLENFVESLTGRISISTDIIKDLSLNIFEVISFCKELLDCWNKMMAASPQKGLIRRGDTVHEKSGFDLLNESMTSQRVGR